ncbi:uncharacterized protein ASPGLDRAFT_332666 [Aspergillus glaucus CBS 516.65]|uniref:MARVEL domain-containing protein n=1 Tax=Aspergillus glaucus CBS 516.65 TaxID=1160497 RepID=A0A1L9VKL0_ASPGL|nr:hypothetical protein ASPGLDRAFT_332666 [Aspergillus glaucus CBS 516.65]OJJ84434.1 hypothetical protein ASPGLDRAFT_332666 [Aspergillus glaucus CBS 516.65]
MKISRHISHDSHPAILILRVATIFASIMCVVAFAWMFKAHDEMYTDGTSAFLTLFPLIFTAYALFWSLLILAIRIFSNAFIHPAIYIIFDLIAFGTVLGWCATKLELVASYGSQYSCNHGPPGSCDTVARVLKGVGYFGCVVGILDSVLYLVLLVWACWVCSKGVRGVQKG